MSTNTGATSAQFSEHRTSRKPGLSLQRHQELGAVLRTMNADITRLCVEVANAYPRNDKHTRKALAGLNKTAEGLAAARCWLEELLMDDFPEYFSTRIYYGAGDEADDRPDDLPDAGV